MPDEHENLPAVPDGAAVEELVLDGEVVDDVPPSPRLIPAPVMRVAASPHARLASRHAAYVAAGAVVAVRRWHQRRTRHERQMRAAEAAGNYEAVLQLRQQREAERKGRHERRADTAEKVVLVARGGLWILGFTLAAPGILGLFWGAYRHSWPAIPDPYFWIATLVGVAVKVAVVTWTVASIAVPLGVLAWLHHLGRHAGDLAPKWTAAGKQAAEERGLVVTADSIVLALQNLPVSKLTAAFKDGWKPAFHTLPVKDGEGYTAVFSVPLGVTADMIADQVEVLARNLHRAKTEVWPTDAERGKIAPAGFVSVWVANPGVLDRGAPEYPLLHEGEADVFRGVPAGVSPRGDAIAIPVVGNNFVVGGIMGQGKSNACRVVMLGGALDPLCELWVHVFAYNADFDAYAPRLARYVKGAEDGEIAAAMESLHELYAEVSRREARLAEMGALKVTRALAQREPDMRPRMVLFSECHELFGHKDYGGEATELAVKTIRRARKTGLWMGFDTQDARKDAIPPKIVGLVSVNACFAVKSWRANDGFLGDGSFQAGIRATELRPGRDVGRSLVTGVSDAQFELLKWHYIPSDDERGVDEARPPVARAVAGASAGTAIGGTRPPAIESRDLLDDLDAVLGAERVKLRDAVGLLRRASSSWYRSLTARQLAADLAAEGVRTVNVSGTMHLDPPELRRVLAERDGAAG